MAIDNTTVVPRIIAAAFLVAYRKARVFADRTNNTWRSALRNAGDTVIINQPGTGSISDYTSGGTVTYGDADVGTPITLSIDKVKSWAIKFDDLEAAKASLPVLQQQVQESANELALVVDRDVKASMDAVGGATDPGSSLDLALNQNSPALTDMKLNAFHRLLDLQDVPLEGRFVIVGPYTAEYIRTVAAANDRILAGPRDSVGNQLLNNGVMGSFQGFTWYVSNNRASGSTDSTVLGTARAAAAATANSRRVSAVASGRVAEPMYIGNNSATAFVEQINRTEQIRLQTTFADAIRGLYSYGSKVIKPERLIRANIAIQNPSS